MPLTQKKGMWSLGTKLTVSAFLYAGIWFNLLLSACTQANPIFEIEQNGTKLVGTGRVGNSLQGSSVALSSSGDIALVGAPGDDFGVGASWVFERTLGAYSWSQVGSKLVGPGRVGAGQQGAAVALSSNGQVACVGGPYDNAGRGAVWVFSVYRNSTNIEETQFVEKLNGTGAIGPAKLGSSVAVSGDATIVAGGPDDNLGFGASWVFVSLVPAKLVGTGAIGNPAQGRAVAISFDGNTVVIGGPQDNSGVGAAWIFIKLDNQWVQQGPKLVGQGSIGDSQQGISVSISENGNIVVVGGYQDRGGIGAAWVFVRSSGIWTQQTKIVASGFTGVSRVGYAVAISADGDTVVLGGYSNDGGIGATWIFRWDALGGVWNQEGRNRVGRGGVGENQQQGTSVAVNWGGDWVIVGGNGDDSDIGAVWILRSVWVAPTASPYAADDTGAIVGGVMGGLIALTLIVALLLIRRSRRRSKSTEAALSHPPIPPTTTPATPNTMEPTVISKYSVMISYNESNKSQADTVYNILVADVRFNVIYATSIHSFVDDWMVNAVARCDAMIIIVSPGYNKSENCRIEATLAKEGAKKIIPIKMDPKYIPESWLAAIMVGRKWYDGSSAKALRESVSAIIHLELRQKLDA